jgi:hypothetical protein
MDGFDTQKGVILALALRRNVEKRIASSAASAAQVEAVRARSAESSGV